MYKFSDLQKIEIEGLLDNLYEALDCNSSEGNILTVRELIELQVQADVTCNDETSLECSADCMIAAEAYLLECYINDK